MGYIRHDVTLIATNPDRPGGLPDIDAFRESMPEQWRPLIVGPIPGVINGDVFYAFLPDGSKEGWGDSEEGDNRRAEFRALFTTHAYEDGSSADDVVTVSFGGDHGSEVGVTTECHWPPYNLTNDRG